jgi:hypothetical protein
MVKTKRLPKYTTLTKTQQIASPPKRKKRDPKPNIFQKAIYMWMIVMTKAWFKTLILLKKLYKGKSIVVSKT